MGIRGYTKTLNLSFKFLKVLGSRITFEVRFHLQKWPVIPICYFQSNIINKVTKTTNRRATIGFIDTDADLEGKVEDGIEVATVVKFASVEVVFDGVKVVFDGVKVVLDEVGNTTPPLEVRPS